MTKSTNMRLDTTAIDEKILTGGIAAGFAHQKEHDTIQLIRKGQPFHRIALYEKLPSPRVLFHHSVEHVRLYRTANCQKPQWYLRPGKTYPGLIEFTLMLYFASSPATCLAIPRTAYFDAV